MTGVAPLELPVTFPEVGKSLSGQSSVFPEAAQELNGEAFTSHYIQHWVCSPRDSITGITFPFSTNLLGFQILIPNSLC